MTSSMSRAGMPRCQRGRARLPDLLPLGQRADPENEQQAQSSRVRSETRTINSSSTKATNSALFRAAKTTRPTSSATGRVIDVAVKRTGVAIIETPTVIPAQVKQTQAGFNNAFRIRSATHL
jgi:hypothetical protein